mmetsp:Transcript_12259/g.25983  ORF Transcript_12259/g.25983 Transcript_12259/m.25983 type:complete len:203 (-) Transcript_12259:397-1005(-)
MITPDPSKPLIVSTLQVATGALSLRTLPIASLSSSMNPGTNLWESVISMRMSGLASSASAHLRHTCVASCSLYRTSATTSRSQDGIGWSCFVRNKSRTCVRTTESPIFSFRETPNSSCCRVVGWMSVVITSFGPSIAAAWVSTPTPAPRTTTVWSRTAVAACLWSSRAASTDPGQVTSPKGSSSGFDFVAAPIIMVCPCASQ